MLGLVPKLFLLSEVTLHSFIIIFKLLMHISTLFTKKEKEAKRKKGYCYFLPLTPTLNLTLTIL